MELHERIKQAWAQYPEAVVLVQTVLTGERAPRVKSLPKNELRVIIRYGRRPMMYVHKGSLKLTASFRGAIDLNILTDDELRKIGVLPRGSQHCSTCGCFTTGMYISTNDSLICRDCLKAEKETP